MFIQQQAPYSHKTAIVKLIPKSRKFADIRNWRPISLLNCDYKILAKIITFQGRTQGGLGVQTPPIGLSTKMHSKENITFLAHLSLFFCNDKDSNMI